MKRFSVFIAIVLTAAALASGCASVPRTPTTERGLFQQTDPNAAKIVTDGAQNDPALPISIAPSTVGPSPTGFIWPVKQGRVSSFFGSRRRDYHEGIDIRTERGNPVLASKDGEVIYSSRKIHGYGNMIVIKHGEGYATVYAHNRKNLVKVGEHVTQGQVVGYVGATGKATGPHVHFEIRKGELPQDPLLYLPQVRTPAVAHK